MKTPINFLKQDKKFLMLLKVDYFQYKKSNTRNSNQNINTYTIASRLIIGHLQN